LFLYDARHMLQDTEQVGEYLLLSYRSRLLLRNMTSILHYKLLPDHEEHLTWKTKCDWNSQPKLCIQMYKSQLRDTKFEKKKSTYLPPKVTNPKYYLKWRWSALNPREYSKEYIWEWPMKLKMTWMNSKRKQIKGLKLKAQSWLRSPCLLLTGVLGFSSAW
jgi:hypothetical protein